MTGGVIVSLLVGVTLSGCKQRLDEQKPDWPPTSGRPDWAPAPTRELKPEDIEGIFQPPPNPEFEEQRIQEILGREIPRDEARMITGR